MNVKELGKLCIKYSDNKDKIKLLENNKEVNNNDKQINYLKGENKALRRKIEKVACVEF